MFRRILWFVIGAGVAIFVSIKIREYLKKARPEAIGQRVSESASGISDSAATSSTGYEPVWPSAKRSCVTRSACQMTNFLASRFSIQPSRNTS